MPAIGTSASSAYAVEVMGPKNEIRMIEVNSPLIGVHQHRNIALAIAAAVELTQNHGFPITPAAIAAGIRATKWPGRLEHLKVGGITWILDVAHNPAGAWALRAGLRDRFETEFAGKPKALLFSCLRDKPLAEIAQILFPVFDRVIFAPISSLRAATMNDLMAAAEDTGAKAQVSCRLRVPPHRHRRGESSQAQGGRLRRQPHVLHGYARHLRHAAFPVPHPG